MTGISSLQIIFAGSKRVGSWWNYRNVISPFYRLYSLPPNPPIRPIHQINAVELRRKVS